MKEIAYWAIGIAWAMLCLAVGWYVRTRRLGRNKFKIGLYAIIASYLCGLGILVVALVR